MICMRIRLVETLYSSKSKIKKDSRNQGVEGEMKERFVNSSNT
jgi:hypothetical protein